MPVCRMPVELLHQPLQDCAQPWCFLQSFPQSFEVLFADHEGRALETASVAVAAEPQAERAGSFPVRVGQELDCRLMPLTFARGLFDDLTGPPVHLERAWE